MAIRSGYKVPIEAKLRLALQEKSNAKAVRRHCAALVEGETFQFAPAVRIAGQILISGIVGTDAQGLLPPDFRSQAENVFATLEAILNEVGATLDDVASLTSNHAGDT